MVVPLIAAASAALGLFDTGRQIYEAVTGEPPKAPVGDVEALDAEIRSLPPEQAARAVEQWDAAIRDYEARTKRLIAEQGEVTADTLAALPPEAAARVAILRMTTRPWAVRLCARGLVYPPLATLAVDGFLVLLNNVSAALGGAFKVELLATTLLAEGSGFTALYSWFAPMAASVVTAYFGLREVGKGRRGEQTTVSEAVAGAKGLVKTIKRMF